MSRCGHTSLRGAWPWIVIIPAALPLYAVAMDGHNPGRSITIRGGHDHSPGHIFSLLGDHGHNSGHPTMLYAVAMDGHNPGRPPLYALAMVIVPAALPRYAVAMVIISASSFFTLQS